MSVKSIQALRGMNDSLPEQVIEWQYTESVLKSVLQQYGYREIRFPIAEKTDLFKRTAGEVSDIVQKEMYTFVEGDGESFTLRPEGTAGCMRACLEHNLFYNHPIRLWYLGPMFRRERPQKGRYRQFHQLGVEAVGYSGPDIDVEMVLLTCRFWKLLGIEQYLQLEINSLGTADVRQVYRAQLVDYFSGVKGKLDEDSVRRLLTNPMRILDSKNPHMQEVVAGAPLLKDSLDKSSRDHFESILSLLDDRGVAYRVNPRLVRGLDYYTHMVFEWVVSEDRAQNSVCGGGRYDGLLVCLGGKPTPAVGFALGMERLLELRALKSLKGTLMGVPEVYFVVLGSEVVSKAFRMAEELRDVLPGLRLEVHAGGGSVRSQFKRADQSGARLALVLGEEEWQKGVLTVKFLREATPQLSVPWVELSGFLKTTLML